MTIKAYFAIFAVLSVLFGIGFVLAPGHVLSNYGVENSPAIAVMSRLFGGTLLAIAVILWSARNFHEEVAVRAVLVGIGIADAVNLVVAFVATSSGTINALGWTTVLIYLCGAVGAGYFLTIGKPEVADRLPNDAFDPKRTFCCDHTLIWLPPRFHSNRMRPPNLGGANEAARLHCGTGNGGSAASSFARPAENADRRISEHALTG